MYLLITGSTETARALIADTFLEGHGDWKHLALEDIEEEDGADDEDILGMQMMFMTMVACQCAKDAREEGHSILITCPSPEMIDSVLAEIPERIVTVHLGDLSEADAFDYVIDTRRKSVEKTCRELDGIVSGPGRAGARS